jgi:hypothetical protein
LLDVRRHLISSLSQHLSIAILYSSTAVTVHEDGLLLMVETCFPRRFVQFKLGAPCPDLALQLSNCLLQRLCSLATSVPTPRDGGRRFGSTCSEQSAYGHGAGVAAARGHLEVSPVVMIESSLVVSDAGLGLSSGVGLGVVSDFGLASARWSVSSPAPWSAPCPAPSLPPCPARFECSARGDCLLCRLKLLSAPCF